MTSVAVSGPYSACAASGDPGTGRGRASGSRAGSRRRCRGTGRRARARPGRRRSRPRRSGTGCRARPRCRRSRRGRRSSASSDGIQYGSSDDAVAAAQRLDEQRDAGVGADALASGRRRARAWRWSCGRMLRRAREFTSNDRSWPRRSEILMPMDPALPADVHRRRPAAARSPRRRASSATRSRPSRSTSRRWRPTSARRCCTRRPVAPTEAGTRLLEHAERDPAAPRRRARRRRARRRRAAGQARRSARRRCRPRRPRAPWPPPAARARRWRVTVRVRRRATRSRPRVATGALDAGIVDGVAAPGDPLPLPETGVPVAGLAEEPLALARRRPATRSRAGRACGSRTSSTPAGSTRPASRRRSPSWRCSPAPTASGRALRYDGLDVGGLLALVEHAQGLALLPAAGRAAAACRSPRRRSSTAPSCSPSTCGSARTRSRASSRASSRPSPRGRRRPPGSVGG